jgi:uncharacterized membrane protein
VLPRTGVILAACIELVGGVIYLVRFPQLSDYRAFHRQPENLRTIRGIFGEAVASHGGGLIQLGLAVLIATPISRVAFSVLAFGSQRDWKYVFFTVVVLCVPLYSAFGQR